MAERLNRPLTRIAGPFNGPVVIGKFDDGTLCIAGPNDQPILIRDGAVMTLAAHDDNGDLQFSYFTDAERASWKR